MGLRWWAALAATAVIAGCGGGTGAKKTQSSDGGAGGAGGTGGTGGTGGSGGTGGTGGTGGAPPIQIKAPVVQGDFTFYGTDQGLGATVYDVSADEAGNVYVAAGDAVFARKAADRDFARFDETTSGLTKNCHDPAQIANPTPPDPLVMCPIISVAGSTPGKAIIGFKGVGTDGDADAEWALASGGADVVRFDGAALTRDRHVFVASPPGVICEHWADWPTNTVCAETYVGSTWQAGRKKMRQIQRIVVNHDQGHPLSYGDVYMGGTHGSISVLVAHPDQRGWIDYTKGDPAWADTRFVWEHHHPALDQNGVLLTGSAYAIGLDPVANVPWYANEFRMASLQDYATTSHPTWNGWWGDQVPAYPHLWMWQQAGSQTDASLRDNVSSISFCPDGTMWVGSDDNGLAHISLDRTNLQDLASGYAIARIPTPDGTGGALAVACDPSDGSVWVGFSWGGFGRYRDGGGWTFLSYLQQGAPAFTVNPVRSIQIDRWSTPRRVYFAHVASARFGPGGVTVYTGR